MDKEKTVFVAKLTRDARRAMDVGETIKFCLPTANACDSGRSMAYQFRSNLRCRFAIVTNRRDCTLIITKHTT